jgi:CBS domain-containing protein
LVSSILLTHVSDVMRSGDAVPCVLPSATFSELMREMSAKGLGASAVVDAQRKDLGIFTDGDLRRLIEKGVDMRTLNAEQVMHSNPRTTEPMLWQQGCRVDDFMASPVCWWLTRTHACVAPSIATT